MCVDLREFPLYLLQVDERGNLQLGVLKYLDALIVLD